MSRQQTLEDVTRLEETATIGAEPVSSEPRPTRRQPGVAWSDFALLASIAMLVLLYVFSGTLLDLSIRRVSVFLILVVAVCYALLARQRGGIWGAPALSFIVLAIFHAGLYVSPAFTGNLADESVFHSSWFMTPYAQHAALVSAFGFAGFTFGSSLVNTVILRRKAARSVSLSTPEAGLGEPRATRALQREQAEATTGAILVIAAASFWFYENITANGFLFFTLGYDVYFETSKTLETGYTVLPIMIGMGLVAKRVRGFLPVLGVVFFGAYALASFSSGARIYALSAITVFIVVYALRHKMPRGRMFWVALLGTLSLVSLIRSIRSMPLASVIVQMESVNPLWGLAELGSSVKVVGMVVTWHTTLGEPFAGGATYLNPLMRGINTLTGVPNLPSDADPNSLIGVVAARHGQIGGSIIAEAYHNYAWVGTVIILAIWGMLITYAYQRGLQGKNLGPLILVITLYLLQVRGFFGPIPAMLIIGSIILVMAAIVADLDLSLRANRGFADARETPEKLTTP